MMRSEPNSQVRFVMTNAPRRSAAAAKASDHTQGQGPPKLDLELLKVSFWPVLTKLPCVAKRCRGKSNDDHSHSEQADSVPGVF